MTTVAGGEGPPRLFERLATAASFTGISPAKDMRMLATEFSDMALLMRTFCNFHNTI
jgi:hypothetical protein